MKAFYLLIAVIVVAAFSILSHAQQRPSAAPTVQINFSELSEYVNGSDSRNVGRRFIVNGVPLNAAIKKYETIGLFILEAGSDDDRVQLFTSPALARRLRPRLHDGGQVRVRVTCTLIELRGAFDISWRGFVTKVERLGRDGSVAWVETGPAPPRLRYRV